MMTNVIYISDVRHRKPRTCHPGKAISRKSLVLRLARGTAGADDGREGSGLQRARRNRSCSDGLCSRSFVEEAVDDPTPQVPAGAIISDLVAIVTVGRQDLEVGLSAAF